MSAAQVFALANPFALVGWLILAAAIVLRRPWWRDEFAGVVWPVLLSVLYIAVLAVGWATTTGSLSSLAGVRELFSNDWALLAGWVHYLAFDLIVGAWIAAQVERADLSRFLLIPVLPLTFLFGPMGFFLFIALRRGFGGGAAAEARIAQGRKL
jgi:hypothetical protein